MDSFTATAQRSTQVADAVARHPERFRVLTGERPTGALHLGHYFGTIRERVRLQEAGVETFLVLADYQVITDRDTTAHVRDNVQGAVLDYLAAGIDPERTTVFTHSSVPALNQLLLPFLSLVTEAELHRNPTVKSELEASGRALSGLLLTYPVHQAADILFCKGNLVPVGKDNLPHVEMTRVIARRFNERYGPIFPVPDALVTAAPEVPGLDGRKMSKSYGNAIALSMTADETVAAIRRARTDQDRRITFDPEHRRTEEGHCDGGERLPGTPAGAASRLRCRRRDRAQRASSRQRARPGDRRRNPRRGARGDGDRVLVVMSRQVVESADGWVSDGGVVPVMIVEVHPGG